MTTDRNTETMQILIQTLCNCDSFVSGFSITLSTNFHINSSFGFKFPLKEIEHFLWIFLYVLWQQVDFTRCKVYHDNFFKNHPPLFPSTPRFHLAAFIQNKQDANKIKFNIHS